MDINCSASAAPHFLPYKQNILHMKHFIYKIRNCSEPTSKMLRISSVWRIRQIKFQKQA